jgi:transposase InsO family protein
MAPETRVGCDFAHAIVDDHSRLAYVELHPDEKATTVTAFVERALAWFDEREITTRRLMTDNAFSYVKNRSLRELSNAARSSTYARRPTGRAPTARLRASTMARQWGYGLAYRSHRHRNRALPHWLTYYNDQRPHSAIGGLPPISRIHNVCGQDN